MKLSAKFTAKAAFAAFAIAGSLAAVAPAAQALPVPPPGPGSTSLGYQCFYTQQDYINGVAEFKAAYAANDQAAMDAAGTKLRGAESGWTAAGCGAVYGDIGTNRVAPPPKAVLDAAQPVTPPVKSNPAPNPKPVSGTTTHAPSSASVN
jgi:hypothetical protein